MMDRRAFVSALGVAMPQLLLLRANRVIQ